MPSSLRVEVPYAAAGFPERFRRGRAARTALADFLTRQMAAQFERCSFKAKGSGKSGLMSITRCGQEVLERSACEISGNVEGADGGRTEDGALGAGNAKAGHNSLAAERGAHGVGDAVAEGGARGVGDAVRRRRRAGRGATWAAQRVARAMRGARATRATSSPCASMWGSLRSGAPSTRASWSASCSTSCPYA